MNIAELAFQGLLATSATEKAALILQMQRAIAGGVIADGSQEPQEVAVPGLPPELQLVHPRELKRRSLQSTEGKACFLHAIAHIEYNAINLALDALYRFQGLPAAYYSDWLLVAEQEVDHHQKIVRRLEELGSHYGAFPAHNGLWDIAVRTAGDLVSRMALVPCVFEARGLDVTPPMIERMQRTGDHQSAALLQFILDEEVGHVEIGVRWYQYACRQSSREPIETFLSLMQTYLPNKPQGPFNMAGRLQAGFTEDWLSRLESMTPRA